MRPNIIALAISPLLIAGATLLAAALSAPPALAHVILTSHETRHGANSIKVGPCGRTLSERGDRVHRFEPGETIRLEWDEFVSHPGHFRISFDAEGDDDFVDPAGYDDFYSDASVLVDGLYPHDGGASHELYAYELTLPDVTCDLCTLQLVQMMTDKPPYAAGTDDLYYNCLDLILVPEPLAAASLWAAGLALWVVRRWRSA